MGHAHRGFDGDMIKVDTNAINVPYVGLLVPPLW